MTRANALAAAGLAGVMLAGAAAQVRQTLDIYFIDVEGGQAVLFATPGGESLLLDSGGSWDARGNVTPRDADRIVAVANVAGLSRVDHLLTTHYHMDHVASAPRVAKALQVRTFIDHGALRGAALEGERGVTLYRDYAAARAGGRHIEMRAGDRMSIEGGLDLFAVVSAARPLTRTLPLPGAGTANPLCAEFTRRPEDTTMVASLEAENASSLGTVLRFGRFSLVDLGDTVWNQEFDLVCPKNLIGEVSVYVTSVHGINLANSRTLVHALRPRIAIWNNGPLKGSREPIDVLRSSPGFEDVWQLHYQMPRTPNAVYGESVESGGPGNNAKDEFIANVTKDVHEEPSAAYIKVSAARDGSFSVTNSRNGFTKQYRAR